jgi:ribosomal protein S18 acetylase RimI-like enzyme
VAALENKPDFSSFEIVAGLCPEHTKAAAAGYWRAFSRKLRYPLGPEAKAIAFIERVLDPDHAISAVSNTGEFLGVAGFKSPTGAFVGGNFSDLVAVYGGIAAIARGLLVSVLERDCAPDTMLMDGIFVEQAARGNGVGKALLDAIVVHAASRQFRHVRLDVIDTNPRARALYEREGFTVRSVQSVGVLRAAFGFSKVAEMTRSVDA